MIMQGWGAPQQRRYIKSTPAAQQTAKRIRKRSEGEMHNGVNQVFSYAFCLTDARR